MDTEPFEKFLSLLVRLLPLLNTERALASDQTIEHELIFMGDPLHVFLFGTRI